MSPALTALALAFFPVDISIPGTDPLLLDRLVQLGKQENRAMSLLAELTSKIGPRLTGSSKGLLGCQWSEAKFKSFGIANARLEEYGTMAVGFDRGPRQRVRVVAPFQAELQFTTDAWTAGTDGPLRGRIVLAPKSSQEMDDAVRGSLRGAWVLEEAQVGREQSQSFSNAQIYASAGALGRITPSTSERISTGGRSQNLTWDNLPKDRRIKIKKSDADRMLKDIGEGKTVELEADVENRFVQGPVKLYNVIADIPGTEKPDEFVIIGAHLDSWDGPGSMGANDNGTGSCAVIEAARLLVRAGIRPKRTIRFILFTGEEQGLLGSRGYVEKHKAEWDKISAAFIDDGGTNYHGGHQCLASQVPVLQPVVDLMTFAFPAMPQKLQVIPTVPRGGSSDHAAFIAQGIPGFYTIESGRADYAHIWHTQNDRPEFTIPEYLSQAAVDFALTAYAVANAEKPMPRG